jgi:ADP-ribose pyrophosphatase YjhB (NUDIX family)
MRQPNDFQYCPYDGESLVANTPAIEGRSSCPRCDFVDYQNPKPCVNILIIKGDRLLLARRRDEPAKGEWDIPGGFIEARESAEEAAVREALEETTLHVRVTEYLGSVPDAYGARQIPTLNFCYLVEVLSGEPRAQSDVESLAWFSLDNLPDKLAFEHQTRVIAMLRQKLGARG